MADALTRMAGTARGTHVLHADMAAVAQRSVDALLRTTLRPAIDAAFGTAPVSGACSPNTDPKLQYLALLTGNNTFNALTLQLQVVARMVDAGMSGATGVRRQVYFVSLGGFDSHDFQNRNQVALMARVAQAMRYIDTTLGALGARGNVTTFTGSDFGRTFTAMATAPTTAGAATTS